MGNWEGMTEKLYIKEGGGGGGGWISVLDA